MAALVMKKQTLTVITGAWLAMAVVAPAATPAAPSNSAAAAKADSADSSRAVRVVSFQLNGRTVDIQAYTTFLRQLAASRQEARG